MALSAFFSFISNELLSETGIAVSFFVLLMIIFIGVVFDVVGVAFTAATEQPFHSMAARKIPEAQQALTMLRHADHVSNLCNDVIGDVCGIVSGAAAAAIATNAFFAPTHQETMLVQLLLSAAVAGLTVGGKAFGKSFAINNATSIVHTAAKSVYYIKLTFNRLTKPFRRKN